MTTLAITELLGDGIGPELANAVHTVAEALPIDCAFDEIDWSLSTRERDINACIDYAEASIRQTKVALKYPTATQTVSPNALIRRRLNFSVIHRPIVSIPGIPSNFKQNIAIHIVRVATGGTYDDAGQMVGQDAAVSLRLVERKPCEQAAYFAFHLARQKKLTVTSASKYTIQRVTDGLFESIVKKVHHPFSDVQHKVELFDALLGKIILQPEAYQVVLVLNEYGDFLSDMASGLVGSLGTGASGNYSFTDDHQTDLALFDAAGGTAPDIVGQGLANPTAILLAFAMLLEHRQHTHIASALQKSLFDTINAKVCTPDLGGSADTQTFTAAVVDRLKEQGPL